MRTTEHSKQDLLAVTLTTNTRQQSRSAAFFLLALCMCVMATLSLSACGQKGPLFYPEEALVTEVTPAPLDSDPGLKPATEKGKQKQ